MTEDIELTQEEKEAILQSREQKEKELEEQLAKEKEALIKHKSSMERQKERELRSLKHEYDNAVKVFNELKNELPTEDRFKDAIELISKEDTEHKSYRTYDKVLPFIGYKLTYLKAEIKINYKRFSNHDNKISVYDTNANLKGNLIECYWLTSNHRKYSVETFVKKLVENYDIAEDSQKRFNKAIRQIKDLLELKKKQYGKLSNVKTVDIRESYTRSAFHKNSICVEFNSGSKIYFGYRYSDQQEPEILKIDDALESSRTEEGWVEIFNNQK